MYILIEVKNLIIDFQIFQEKRDWRTQWEIKGGGGEWGREGERGEGGGRGKGGLGGTFESCEYREPQSKRAISQRQDITSLLSSIFKYKTWRRFKFYPIKTRKGYWILYRINGTDVGNEVHNFFLLQPNKYSNRNIPNIKISFIYVLLTFSFLVSGLSL